MNQKKFKQKLTEALGEYGFSYVNKMYYKENEEMIAIISLQKSNYDDFYYINYGFYLKEENKPTVLPKPSECDIRARFIIGDNQEESDSFKIEELSEHNLDHLVSANVNKRIIPAFELGLKEHMTRNPELMLLASLRLKRYQERDNV